MMELIIDNCSYQVVIERKKIKHMYLRIKDDNVVLITANDKTTDQQINQFIKSNQKTILKLAKHHELQTSKNKDFYYLANKYQLIYNESIKSVIMENNCIYTKDDKMLNKWLHFEIENIFKARLETCYNNFSNKIPYPQVKLRTMKTRWGVCYKQREVIVLNTRLIRYSLDVIDYVIIHELAHFIHPHHQSEFWDLVSINCPNYKQFIKMLKE